MQTMTLSEAAVATLRFEIKGWKKRVRDQDLPAYRELVAVGIMEGDGRNFRLTEWGREHGHEVVEREYDRIERERYEPPDASHLSEAARELLRTCIVRGCPDGDQTNRPAYRELVRARIMIPMGSFTKGDDCVFGWTYWGWHRRFEFAEMSGAKDAR